MVSCALPSLWLDLTTENLVGYGEEPHFQSPRQLRKNLHDSACCFEDGSKLSSLESKLSLMQLGMLMESCYCESCLAVAQRGQRFAGACHDTNVH